MSEQTSEIKRIYENVYFLLVEGIFPGKYTQGLIEAQKFVAELIQKLDKDIKDGSPEDQQSVRSEAGSGGLDGGGVPPKGRQGRKRKAVGT